MSVTRSPHRPAEAGEGAREPGPATARALGRGLEVLIAAQEEESAAGPGAVLQVVPEAIRPNPLQPRSRFDPEELAALADSIARNGIIQPIVVREAGAGAYELVAGERRLRAAKRLGLSTVPVVCLDVSGDRLLEVALVENLQRADLDPIEEARAYRELMRRQGLTQEQLAARVSKARSTVANALRLLELPEEVQAAVAQGAIASGHARAVAGLDDAEAQKRLARRIAAEQWSVREAEREAARMKGGAAEGGDPKEGRKRRRPRPEYLAEIEERLRQVLGTPVTIRERSAYRGEIVLEYGTEDAFEELLERLS